MGRAEILRGLRVFMLRRAHGVGAEIMVLSKTPRRKTMAGAGCLWYGWQSQV
jgi:hypothetical protein